MAVMDDRDGWLSAVLPCVKCFMEVSRVSQPFRRVGSRLGQGWAFLSFPLCLVMLPDRWEHRGSRYLAEKGGNTL
jgi:hypothetical protein